MVSFPTPPVPLSCQELPEGASPFHGEHPLFLRKSDRFYSFLECGICRSYTNGFYYHCQSCDITIDICCAFLPVRIKHSSHEYHSLVQTHFSNSQCSASKMPITNLVGYACRTCSRFQISVHCAYFPISMKHRYDDHPITMEHPPFFYEGLIYCEICEEQINNQWWLYHCSECDQSFHIDCLRWLGSVKLGGTIKLNIDDKPHTLALVAKGYKRKNSSPYACLNCKKQYKSSHFFECDGCGFLLCRQCVNEIVDEYDKSVHI